MYIPSSGLIFTSSLSVYGNVLNVKSNVSISILYFLACDCNTAVRNPCGNYYTVNQ